MSDSHRSSLDGWYPSSITEIIFVYINNTWRGDGALGHGEMCRVRQHPVPVFVNEVQKTLSTKPSVDIETDETAHKRAQSEHFSFDVDAP